MMDMPAERPVVGSGPERARMRTRAHNQAEIPPPPVRSAAPQHRLVTARGVLLGVILGLLSWVLLGLLLWLGV
jgi:hypothetical protein